MHMGVVGIGSATIATIWNFLFNLGFDHGMRRMFGSTTKTFRIRLVHTVLFEIGLLAILLRAAVQKPATVAAE